MAKKEKDMVKDILLLDTYDLAIDNGDFVVGASDQQHMVLIVETFEGNWKQFPLQGVGIDQYQAAPNAGNKIRRDIKVKAEADGFINVNVELQQDNEIYKYNVTADRP